MSIWTTYHVELQIRELLCGGVPKDPSTLLTFTRVRTGHEDDITTGQVEELEETVTPDTLSPDNLKNVTTFQRDEHGLFLHERNIKAMLKECAQVLGFNKKLRGLKQVNQHGLFVKGQLETDRVYLEDPETGEYMTAVSGELVSPVHAWTGSSIKRTEYVQRPILRFDLWVLADSPWTDEAWQRVWMLAQENGIGACRSQGYGKFDLLAFTRTE